MFTIDIDAFVMNPAIRLESLLPPNYEESSEVGMVLSSDTSVMHTAQVLYLRKPWTLQTLKYIWKFPDEAAPIMEQGACNAWLCGANRDSSSYEVKKGFERCDIWRGSPKRYVLKMSSANSSEVPEYPANMFPNVVPERAKHLFWVPQRRVNSYVRILSRFAGENGAPQLMKY